MGRCLVSPSLSSVVFLSVPLAALRLFSSAGIEGRAKASWALAHGPASARISFVWQ